MIRACVNAFIRDASGRVLLTRRADNGLWCLPGGHVELGETLAQAVCRETEEETGLKSEAGPLIGFFADPDRDRAADGSYPVATALFLCSSPEGKPVVTEETSAVGWFSENGLPELWSPHVPRVKAGFESLR